MKIIITDGINTQTRKLKDTVTLERASELLEDLYNDDYLGCSYYLEDNNGNELLAFEY